MVETDYSLSCTASVALTNSFCVWGDRSYLDPVHTHVADVLPSDFIAKCFECDTVVRDAGETSATRRVTPHLLSQALIGTGLAVLR